MKVAHPDAGRRRDPDKLVAEARRVWNPIKTFGGRGGRPGDAGGDAGGDGGPDAGRGAGTARIVDHKRPCGVRDFLKSPPQSKASL